MLFIGVFAPIVSIPIAGNQNYFQNGKGDGVVLLLLAGISLALLLANKIRRLIWTGAAALAVLLFTFVNFQYRMADLRESMEAELAGNPFAGLADMAIQSVQLQWGWAVLAVGAGLLIGAGVTAPDDAAFDIA